MDYEFGNGLQGFQNVWMRVTGENQTAGKPDTLREEDLLASFIRGENRDSVLYAALAKNCNVRWRETLNKIKADEMRHMKALELEYYLYTGDSYPLPKTDYRPPEGILSSLRGAYISERESAASYASAAEHTQYGPLKELYLKHAEDEANHAVIFRRLAELALG